jgi:hypothetical protein
MYLEVLFTLKEHFFTRNLIIGIKKVLKFLLCTHTYQSKYLQISMKYSKQVELMTSQRQKRTEFVGNKL